MMLRVADELCKRREALVIINGESIGQVASQTLHSMVAINEVTNTPVIRPVVTMDKLDIIQIAQNIDTFDLSIQPYEDCCTVFAPDAPKTKPKLDKVHAYEERLAIDELVKNAVDNVKVYEITSDSNLEATDDFSELF